MVKIMNILYISKLDGNKWQGPNQSVPNQIKAQSYYDNVFWYNINNVLKDEWIEKIKCHNLLDFPKITLNSLPLAFQKPDLVIFEGVYEYPFCRIIYELWDKGIPYIIIPRSSLTDQAQESKRLKKKIGNFLFFKRFIKKAVAVQYLTTNEYLNSGNYWNDNHLIIPNGIDSKEKIKMNFNSDKLIGIFIGRVDIYQKGLDLLLEACNMVQNELRNASCIIKIYGPDRNESKEELLSIIKNYNIQDIIFIHDAIFDLEKENVQLESDFCILTSRFEGHPMGLIEALSYGLPCLVTDGTNMSNEIENAKAGWTSEVSVAGIVRSLRTMLEEKDNLSAKSENALKLSVDYNWSKLADASSYEYRNILNKNC